MTGHGAQCLMCKYQVSRNTTVTGCLRFENSKLDADTAGVLTALLFQNAGRARCPGMERLEFGPDAYRSIDLPERKSKGRLTDT